MIRLLLVFMLTCVAIANAHLANPVLTVAMDEEENAVYAALLNEKYIAYPTNSLLIVEQTDASESVARNLDREDILSMLSPISSSTVAAFKERNRSQYSIKGRLDLKVKYSFLRQEDLDKFFKGDLDKGWDEFNKKYPESYGYVRLSSVAFDSGKSEALVFVEHGCGSLCGTGYYLLLSKTEKGWKVSKMVLLWVS